MTNFHKCSEVIYEEIAVKVEMAHMWTQQEKGPGPHCSISLSLPIEWAFCVLCIDHSLTEYSSERIYQLTIKVLI